MSPNESFDELEQKIAERMEEALSEIREEFLERLQGARDRLDEVVKAELVAAKEEAAAVAASAAEAEAAQEETRAALLAETEEAKAVAIAEALEAKEADFSELLGARDQTIAAAEQARDAALAEAEEAKATLVAEAEETRSTLLAEAEEDKSAAIAAALESKETEFSEALAAKNAALAELDEAKDAALATAAEEKEAAVAEAQATAAAATSDAIVGTVLQLHEIVTNIDAAQSQTEVLEALLTGTAGFASRGLLFLTREDGLQGWGGQGFDTPEGHLQEIHLDYGSDTAWAELAQGRGTVKMSGEACMELCQSVDGSAPEEGVLIPLVLRDRLAAALYADRLEEHSPYLLAMLQLLTYVVGQALESLPMRQRSSTATLRLVTETPAEEAGLELWQFLAPEEPIEEYAPELVEEPVPVPAEPEEMVAEEAFVEPIEPLAPVEEIPEPEPPQWQDTAEDAGFEVEEAEEEAVAEIVEDEVVEEVIEDVTPPIVAEPVAEIPPTTEVTSPTDVAPPTEVAPPAAVVPPAAGAEVAPPEDLDGPGWAFTTRRFATEGSDDASHEEARRLARLLVTEIKLYNEEQVEEGRRSRSIYRTLKEDIDRSRQIYEERIEEAVRMETDYFQEELVKILAAGDAEVLGS